MSTGLAPPVTRLSSYGNTFKVAYGGSQPAQNYLSGMMVSAVPEPESYAMMIVGLGLVAAIARRRKAKAV
jgi:PEP-CTERM motif